MDGSPITPLMSSNSNNTIILLSPNNDIKYNKKYSYVELTTSSLRIAHINQINKTILQINTLDIIGSSIRLKKNKDLKLRLFYYPIKLPGCCNSYKDGNIRYRKVLELDFLSNEVLTNRWLNAIRSIVYKQLSLFLEDNNYICIPPNYLIIVNPVGGQGLGLSIWKKYVLPMLQEADIKKELLVTEYANHAKNYISDLNLKQFHAILCIGGDGLVYEVMNGIISRTDGEEILKVLPIMHIPGGTANGLSKSILYASNHASNPLNATFVSIKGNSYPLDLSKVITDDKQSHLSFLSMSWGLVSDVDILSESMRYLGETRLYLAAVYFIIKRKYYKGRLKMRLIDNYDSSSTTKNNIFTTNNIMDDSTNSNKEINSDIINTNIDNNHNWTIIEGDFLMVWVVQTSHVASTIYSGPGITLNDGLFTIFVVQEMSRFEMLQLLIGLDAGEHVKHPKVKTYKCTAYILEPLLVTEKGEGILAVDGEVIKYGTITATLLPSAARVLVL